MLECQTGTWMIYIFLSVPRPFYTPSVHLIILYSDNYNQEAKIFATYVYLRYISKSGKHQN